jgi:hypothetical protein
MTATQSLNLYNIALVKEIEVVVDNKFADKKDSLASKEDIANVRLEIKETKTELIRWVFAFFVTLALMILGLYVKTK